MTTCVVDTHALVWFLAEDPRLTARAKSALDSALSDGLLIVPSIVLAEMMYIAEKGRVPIPFKEVVRRLEPNKRIDIAPLDLETLKIASEIRANLEIHDRVIVATAIFYNARLITKDEAIERSRLVSVVW